MYDTEPCISIRASGGASTPTRFRAEHTRDAAGTAAGGDQDLAHGQERALPADQLRPAEALRLARILSYLADELIFTAAWIPDATPIRYDPTITVRRSTVVIDPIDPMQARALADAASEAIRALNHATLPADGCPALDYPADAYDLLAALHELTTRLPQLLEQISAFLQRQLQHDLVAISDGAHAGDPLAAIGIASYHLELPATIAARRLEAALDTAREAIAFASSTRAVHHDW